MQSKLLIKTAVPEFFSAHRLTQSKQQGYFFFFSNGDRTGTAVLTSAQSNNGTFCPLLMLCVFRTNVEPDLIANNNVYYWERTLFNHSPIFVTDQTPWATAPSGRRRGSQWWDCCCPTEIQPLQTSGVHARVAVQAGQHSSESLPSSLRWSSQTDRGRRIWLTCLGWTPWFELGRLLWTCRMVIFPWLVGHLWPVWSGPNTIQLLKQYEFD